MTEETMQVQINTDKNIDGREALTAQFRDVVESALSRFSEQITRVEVHVGDHNSTKSGPADKRCMIEARLKGHKPAVATHEASSVEEAVDGAADKLKRSLESTLGRLRDKR
jgi:ribosome-associated translation inhibitor RaiA